MAIMNQKIVVGLHVKNKLIIDENENLLDSLKKI